MSNLDLINLEGISRFYGEGETLVKALDGVDLKISEGEIVALLGPSGSGKTTLLNVISALDVPTEGNYNFRGTKVPLGSVEKMTTFRRENVGYIFQFFNLISDLTAEENVLLVQQLSGLKDKERARRMLSLVGLAGLENRFPAQMSGGQRQRVAIARALAKSPRIILGDELTGNLDSKTSRQVMEALIDIVRAENSTLIYVTHDEKLTRYATRVIKLDSGKIISDESGELATPIGHAKDGARKLVKEVSKIGDTVSTTLNKLKDVF